MNITVKAPEGGRYNIDIQKVRERFYKWRWRQMRYLVVILTVLVVWTGAFGDPTIQGHSWVSFKQVMYWFAYTWAGWVAVALFSVLLYVLVQLANARVHFQCPHKDCNMAIEVGAPWVCPYCVYKNVMDPWLFWWTFFDKCKKGHVPESYKCPSCANEPFELIPNGRKNKFAYRYYEPVQPVQPPPVQQQDVPRDRFF